MAYSTCRRLLALIPNLTNNSGSIDSMGADVFPGSAQLIDFLSSGCSLINAKLMSLGYAAPAAATTTIYDYLGQLEATYGAWQAEAARSSPRVSQGERTRADLFKRSFEDGLKMLELIDLGRAGLAIESTTDWYIGGISKSDKDAVKGDSNRVGSRFERGQFSDPATKQPTSSAS